MEFQEFSSPLEFDFINRTGVVVRSQGIELVRGSFLQFYAPGWSKGYFSSNWSDQVITKNADGSMTVEFRSADKKAEGRQTFRKTPGGFEVENRFLWHGTEPCLAESTIGLVKLRPFQNVLGDKAATQPLTTAKTGSEEARRFFAEPQSQLTFASANRELRLQSDIPFVAFDARGWEQDWARSQAFAWVGHPALELKKDLPLTFTVRWSAPVRPSPLLGLKRIQGRFEYAKDAVVPEPVRGAADLQLKGKPKLAWRGIHLFVGPQSEAVHAKLAKSVLPKLKINKVLLQCEQTKWSSLKTNGMTNFTELASLKRIFANYRKNGIEPIPMIQSFGHMEWFFGRSQNLDVAFNPMVPYAIDPRKPEAIRRILAIWDEAIRELKPKEIHFGLDEVDMRGFPDDPALTTELWRIMLPKLSEYAASKKLPWMLWGDKMLGPGQAPDAALGDSIAEATKRREVVPKTATITDWHYLNNPNPAVYNNVKLWREWGYQQIGSVWNRPLNVYGYTHAMINSGERGMLQTIWAGYHLSERSMMENWGQYASTVLLADYAYSGRKELPDKLPYKPEEVLRDLWFGADTKRQNGMSFVWGSATSAVRHQGTAFQRHAPVSFYDAYTGENPISAMAISVNEPIAEVRLLMRAKNPVAEGKSVLLVTLNEEDISVHYGWDVRAEDDPRSLIRSRAAGEGMSVVVCRFDKPQPAGDLVLKQLDSEAGLENFGITLIPAKSR